MINMNDKFHFVKLTDDGDGWATPKRFYVIN